MGIAYEVHIGGVAKLPLRGVDVMRAVVKGDNGERSDWEELGVTGVGMEEEVEAYSGRGEVRLLAELEMESERPLAAVASPKEESIEMEFMRLVEDVQRRQPRELTEGFSPLSHIPVEHRRNEGRKKNYEEESQDESLLTTHNKNNKKTRKECFLPHTTGRLLLKLISAVAAGLSNYTTLNSHTCMVGRIGHVDLRLSGHFAISCLNKV